MLRINALFNINYKKNMKKTLKTTLIMMGGLTLSSQAALVMFDLSTPGIITDTTNGQQIGTYTTSGSGMGPGTTTGFDITPGPNKGTVTSTYTLVITNSDYTLASVVWASRGSLTKLGGGAASKGQGLAGFSVDTAGTLTTGAGTTSQMWTLASTPIANGTPTAYTSGDQFVHSSSNNLVTDDDHWEVVATTPSLSGTLTTSLASGDLSLVNESARVTFAFDYNPVPEPSSTALFGLGGLALMARRKR